MCNFAPFLLVDKMIPKLRIEDYDYPLPDSRIAKYPLEHRDASKLLRYKDGKPDEFVFTDLPSLLPADALMIFNDTKVVPARMHFQRPTGAHIEVFCLEPVLPVEYNLNFAASKSCRWKCIVGNVKRWKNDVLTLCNPENDSKINELGMTATLIERSGETAVVEFRWQNSAPFSNVLEICGNIPIPPYLSRETEDVDRERYQTLYARYRGSVAAPTAGLHFTDRVLNDLRAKGIEMETVCLHVGAGTFLPVKSSLVSEHNMHREPFSVSRELIRKLRDRSKPVVAVGTTSVRTLESLYYAGVKCLRYGHPDDIGQWMPYEEDWTIPLEESLDALLNFLDKNDLPSLHLGTKVIIVPSYKFRIVDILVTNFHQPQSTLLLLISAFIGGNWRPMYDFALEHDFRFLSYGDSSLLFRGEPE